MNKNYSRGDSSMTREVSLFVNDGPIALDYFIQRYIDCILGGILAALEGTEEIKTLDVTIEGDKVAINLNNALIPINPFVSKIIKSTIAGMVSPLKGVEKIAKIKIDVRR